MKQSWDLGYVGNGYALSFMLSQGIGGSDSQSPDFVTAYAYSLVTNLVRGKAMEINESPFYGNRVSEMELALENTLGVHLDMEQKIEAQSVAVSLLNSNLNCCIGSWDQYGNTPSSR